MSITIKDIARLANVSHTTVSRALNGSPLISEATKDKIKKIAKENNYVPNTSAQSLKLNRSFNIGIFFTTLARETSASFFYKAVIGANKVIGDQYNLVIRESDSKMDYEKLTKKHFDGIIMVSQSERDEIHIQEIVKRDIPLVVINRKVELDKISSFISNDFEGVKEAIQYLIDSGHKKIGFIKGQKGFQNTYERENGFRLAMLENGVDVIEPFVVEGDYSFESGYKAMSALLISEELPTAVFSSNDDMAIGAMKAIHESGLKVPENISIMGFDEGESGKYLTPSLTTVSRDIEYITYLGTQKLLEMLKKRDLKSEIVMHPSQLIIRESVKKL